MMTLFTIGFLGIIQATSAKKLKPALICLAVGVPFLVGSLTWAEFTKESRTAQKREIEAYELRSERAAANAAKLAQVTVEKKSSAPDLSEKPSGSAAN